MKKGKDSNIDDNESVYKPLKLKDIIAANPGISIPEAVQKLNAHNAAAAMAANGQNSTEVFFTSDQEM